MIRRLSILAFLLFFVGNSISDASPHLDGEGGCPMACCKAAHGTGASSLLPKICCKVDCKQPAGTRTSTSSAQFSIAPPSMPPVPARAGDIWVALNLNHARFPHSLTRIAGGSSRTFLENGALLI